MSYTNLLYHVVYATKERAPLITNVLRPRLHEYLGGTVRGLEGIPIEINGMSDQVHLLVRLRPTISVSEFMNKLKSNSSGWARRLTNGRFSWQSRYGAFTVSESQVEHVRLYIRNQEKHHHKMSFEEEYIALLKHITSTLMKHIYGVDVLSPASQAQIFSRAVSPTLRFAARGANTLPGCYAASLTATLELETSPMASPA